MLHNAHLPILGFAAYSGTGKTTLLLELLPLLKSGGLRVGMVKHAHHSFEIDYPGKDSYKLRKSGAHQVLIASRHRWALMVERQRERDPRLDEVLLELDQGSLDLILVEGFKQETYPKIELHRPSMGRPLLYPRDDSIIAVASDAPLHNVPGHAREVPRLNLNDPRAIADFVVNRMAGDGGALAAATT
ncbi:MAG: molybdopterin-guanine dinucleotide biosynthesis protein B [Gammaproteobacteria bacterium]